MCRNITPLRGLVPEATPDEIRAAALQYVRKVGSLQQLSPKVNDAVDKAVDAIAAATAAPPAELLPELPPPRQPPPTLPPMRRRGTPSARATVATGDHAGHSHPHGHEHAHEHGDHTHTHA